MQRYLSTSPIFSTPVDSINQDSGIIHGVAIAKIGIAKGHGLFIDKTFLLQIVDFASTKPAGIKARFGHPNMCSTALGTYLGRFKNYSYSGDQVKADLFLDNSAKETPSGDLYSYILKMAESNPDMFGASIAFEMAKSVFLEEDIDGIKVKKEYARLANLFATDIVDSPAATDGLFSSDNFPAIATQFLDENPAIMDLIFSKPDSIKEFLSNYLINSNMNLSEKIKDNFAAFVASFSTPVIDPLLPEPAIVEDLTLNTLFEAFRISYPESFSVDVESFTQQAKAESLTAFFESINAKLSEKTDQLQTVTDSMAELQSEFDILKNSNDNLTSQLAARPSNPINVTDPAVGIQLHSTVDNAGKELNRHIKEFTGKSLPKK